MKEGREINCDERLNRQISSDDTEDVSQVRLSGTFELTNTQLFCIM